MHEMSAATPSEASDRKFKVVYTIVERGQDKKPIWLRIGTAFVNRDQSINVKLDAHPQNGTLQIRDYVPFDETRRRADEGGWAAKASDGDSGYLPPGKTARSARGGAR